MPPEKYFPLEWADGGWTVAYVDERGATVPCPISYYTSLTGEAGRADAQERADWNNAIAKAIDPDRLNKMGRG